MTISQEDFIKEVARVEGTGVTTVRKIMQAMGDILFDYLSSATPSEQIRVKLWPGISFESEFIPAHTMEYGIQEGVECPDKIRVHASITRNYKDKINSKEKESVEEI